MWVWEFESSQLLISILKWISYTVYVTLRYDVVSWKAMDMEPFLWAAELILSISANCIFLLPASLISLTLFFPPSLLCMYHIYKNIALSSTTDRKKIAYLTFRKCGSILSMSVCILSRMHYPNAYVASHHQLCQFEKYVYYALSVLQSIDFIASESFSLLI